jgi:hypothetical protein
MTRPLKGRVLRSLNLAFDIRAEHHDTIYCGSNADHRLSLPKSSTMPTISSFYGIYPITMTKFPIPATQDISKIVKGKDSEHAKTWTEDTKPLIMAPSHNIVS